jgi:hypothetical protein
MKKDSNKLMQNFKGRRLKLLLSSSNWMFSKGSFWYKGKKLKLKQGNKRHMPNSKGKRGKRKRMKLLPSNS